jgi:uncharacterized membrane protein (DUF485 family)
LNSPKITFSWSAEAFEKELKRIQDDIERTRIKADADFDEIVRKSKQKFIVTIVIEFSVFIGLCLLRFFLSWLFNKKRTRSAIYSSKLSCKNFLPIFY